MAQKFLTDIEVTRGLVDSDGDLGVAGQVLSSTGSGTNWITNEANSTVVYQDGFTGDGSTVGFTLSVSVTDENITQAYIDGVYQNKDTYSVSGTTLTFSTAPPSNADIEVITFSTATTSDDLAAGSVIIPVKNTHTASIAKGEPVYITGNVGSSARLQVAPADASNSAKMPAAGLLLQTLAVNAEGYVITGGYLRNITTDTIDGTSTSSNDTVYVKSGGGLTMTKPTGTNLIQNIAKVARVASGSAGSLLVSSILRTNDVPNITNDYFWLGNSSGVATPTEFTSTARGLLSVGAEGTASGDGNLAYNNSSGVFTYTPPVLGGLSGTTDDITEGSTNLYYTDARSRSAISVSGNAISYNSSTGVITSNYEENPTFTGNVTIGGNLTVNGTTTTLSTQTVEVEDNILQLNTTQGSPDTATATTSGISIYRGDGVTQASFIFDDADDTWDLTNNLAVDGTSTFSGNITVNKTTGVAVADITSGDNYSVLTLQGGQTGDAAQGFGIYSGYPSAGDFTIRENGVANYLTIAKTTGNATFSGKVTSNYVVSVPTVDGAGNVTPSADEIRLSGYGIIGNRASAVYITNSNSSGSIKLGIGGAHNANTKLEVTSSGIITTGTSIFNGDVTIQSTSSVGLTINADTDNVTEADVPFVSFKMDGAVERFRIGVSDGNIPYLSTDSDLDLGLSIKTGTSNTERMFVNTNGNIDFTANLMPSAENLYNIGSAAVRWEDLYVDDGFIRNAYIDEYIYHGSDTDTYIRFTSDTITFREAGANSLVLDSNRNAFFTGDLTVGTTTSSKKVRAYHSDGNYVDVFGYGLSMSRGSSYIRPVNDNTQNMNFGYDAGNLSWNNIYFEFSRYADFKVASNRVLRVKSDGVEINGNGNGLDFTGGNNRIYFSGYRAMEGATNGSTLQIGEGYNTIHIQDTTLIKYLTSTDSSTFLTLHNDVGADLGTQKTFIDFIFEDDNDNDWPQVRIGAEVGHNGNANSQLKEGSGAFVVYTNNASTNDPGNPSNLAERFRVDYQGHTTATGSLKAPIFYDSNNTNYYTDPASTSVLNGLQFNFTQHGSANNIRMGNSTTMNAISSGTNNAAFGVEALGACSTGSRNFAYGYAALFSLTSGSNNIAMGDATGYNVTSGNNNLLFGVNAGRTGYQTPQSMAGIATASNQIHMGNESHSTARIQISWTVNSDARDKTDVTPINVGLDFVNQLNPVTFRWDKRSDYEDRTPTGENKLEELTLGFLAQEVETVEKAYGYDVATKTNLVVDRDVENDGYGLTYEKMIPILTKAIQELKADNDSLRARIQTLEDN